MSVDIVNLIESNPITKLNGNYQSKMIEKVKNNFNEYEQQMFIASFYCYLNYNKTDFVIDLDNIWKWLGFNQKVKAKILLEKHFIIDKDYKMLLSQPGKQTICTGSGGHNKEIFMLTVKTFKSFCLKASTKKADEIHEYFIKLEELLQEILQEEHNELNLQLKDTKLKLENKDIQIQKISEEKDIQIQTIQKTSEQEKQQILEETIIQQFPKNTECVYIGSIDNTNDNNECLIKFGQSNNLSARITAHKNDFKNFKLIGAFKVQNKVEIENAIKHHPKIKKQIRSLIINEENYKELISIDTYCTINKINKYIKDIIESKICNIDNFNLLVEENEKLKTENFALEEEIKNNKIMNDKCLLKINELEEVITKQNEKIDFFINEYETETEKVDVDQISLIPQNELTDKFDKFIKEECIVRHDVESSSIDIEAQFRIWMKTKPTKEIYHEFKSYLNIKFKPKRLNEQTKNQVVHGFQGVMLKPIEYKKIFVNSDTENFIFNVCNFAPNNRILNSVLLDEYKRWKKSLNKSSISDKDDLKDLTIYLEQCSYVQKGAIWIGNNEIKKTLDKGNYGYYGISLKTDDPYIHKANSSTGKKVNKIETSTGMVLNTWDTIAKAASYEKISPAKMSRSISNNVKFDNNYHYITFSDVVV